jgi:transcriptional regulator with XRE-family HTH domain
LSLLVDFYLVALQPLRIEIFPLPMNITVNQELLAYIDPLTTDEHDALERSLLAEGCRDALVLWGDILVDGHNRYGICRKHGIPFNTVQNTLFKSMDDVHLWMIEQHLGRRSLSDFQRGVLALRKKGILAGRAQSPDGEVPANPASSPESAPLEPKVSREEVAKEARISSNTVSQIEKIQKSASPELVAAVKAGTISINAAATVASLPVEDQVAAAAGGAKELRQAARQVREAKAVARTEPETPEGVIARLTQTISRLKSENAALKEQLAALNS